MTAVPLKGNFGSAGAAMGKLGAPRCMACGMGAAPASCESMNSIPNLSSNLQDFNSPAHQLHQHQSMLLTAPFSSHHGVQTGAVVGEADLRTCP